MDVQPPLINETFYLHLPTSLLPTRRLNNYCLASKVFKHTGQAAARPELHGCRCTLVALSFPVHEGPKYVCFSQHRVSNGAVRAGGDIGELNTDF